MAEVVWQPTFFGAALSVDRAFRGLTRRHLDETAWVDTSPGGSTAPRLVMATSGGYSSSMGRSLPTEHD